MGVNVRLRAQGGVRVTLRRGEGVRVSAGRTTSSVISASNAPLIITSVTLAGAGRVCGEVQGRAAAGARASRGQLRAKARVKGDV